MSEAGDRDGLEQKSGPSWVRLLLMGLPLFVFGALAAVFYLQLNSGRDVSELPSALIGKAAPEFSLPALPGLVDGGKPVPGLAHTDFKDGPVLVNIFASWCAPCRAEHPVLMELSRLPNLQVVGVNYKDNDENARRFLGALGNPYRRVGVDKKGRAAIDWGFYGIPETFLLDKDGIVRHKIVGPIDRNKYQRLVEEIGKL